MFRGVVCKHRLVPDVIFFYALFHICEISRAFIVRNQRIGQPKGNDSDSTNKYGYPHTTRRPWPTNVLGWPCCTTVRGYSRAGFCKDECSEIAAGRNMNHVVCLRGVCQCKNDYHEEKGICVADPEVSIRVLLTVYLASVPLLSIVLALAAVLQYLFDRYLFNADNTLAQGMHEADDVEFANVEDTEAGHRVQFLDGGRPECELEYDWAYEDWQADNPEDKLSQMLLEALLKGSRKSEKS
ncbi:uncharacterized protein LOC111270689 isoform X1 [Varroa jacobsoni]|uniref:uncharacterized protein LOC111270689 isoform X1 n=2 Tax=Varroa jacobsoni TaxID=62625 RepID=UPI000BF29E66|nr:uncharacterized protein LOC111270689 isoform X1 [Varroa jacobsoni]XP_022706782.1 uncharacterized protein LOC111270689 isoform X1 [Varroa jacobsoni]